MAASSLGIANLPEIRRSVGTPRAKGVHVASVDLAAALPCVGQNRPALSIASELRRQIQRKEFRYAGGDDASGSKVAYGTQISEKSFTYRISMQEHCASKGEVNSEFGAESKTLSSGAKPTYKESAPDDDDIKRGSSAFQDHRGKHVKRKDIKQGLAQDGKKQVSLYKSIGLQMRSPRQLKRAATKLVQEMEKVGPERQTGGNIDETETIGELPTARLDRPSIERFKTEVDMVHCSSDGHEYSDCELSPGSYSRLSSDGVGSARLSTLAFGQQYSNTKEFAGSTPRHSMSAFEEVVSQQSSGFRGSRPSTKPGSTPRPTQFGFTKPIMRPSTFSPAMFEHKISDEAAQCTLVRRHSDQSPVESNKDCSGMENASENVSVVSPHKALVELPYLSTSSSSDVAFELVMQKSEGTFRNPLMHLSAIRTLKLTALRKNAGAENSKLLGLIGKTKAMLKELADIAVNYGETDSDIEGEEWQNSEDVPTSGRRKTLKPILNMLRNESKSSLGSRGSANDDDDEDEEEDNTLIDGVLPSHLKVSGVQHAMAEGVFTRIVDHSYEGPPFWMKYGTSFYLCWIHGANTRAAVNQQACSEAADENERNLMVPMLQASAVCDPNWVGGWVLAELSSSGQDATVWARAETTDIENPALASLTWEIRCDPDHSHGQSSRSSTKGRSSSKQSPQTEISWSANNDVFVSVAPRPPDVLYCYDPKGGFAGPYALGDDIDGRASYVRDDAWTIVRWCCKEFTWYLQFVDDEADDPAEKSRLKREELNSTQAEYSSNVGLLVAVGAGDSLDPTSASVWHWHNADVNHWCDACDVLLRPGQAPATHLEVTGIATDGVNGVYILGPQPHAKRPVYGKDCDLHDYSVWWCEDSLAWLIGRKRMLDDFTDPSADLQQHRNGQPPSWLPRDSSAKRFAVTAAPQYVVARGQKKTELPQNVKEWEELTSAREDLHIQVSEVGSAPKELFMDVRTDSVVAGARGVYLLASNEKEGRSCYRKANGPKWQVSWSRDDKAWFLGTVGREPPLRAKASADVQHPTRMVEETPWNVWIEERQSWQREHGITVRTVPIPPRRLFIHGPLQSHPFYGVYFLSGSKNGRPRYEKQHPESAAGWLSGEICWDTPECYWRLYSQPKRGEFWVARLVDDIPLPHTHAETSWEKLDKPTASCKFVQPGFDSVVVDSPQQGVEKNHSDQMARQFSEGNTTGRIGGGAVLGKHVELFGEGMADFLSQALADRDEDGDSSEQEGNSERESQEVQFTVDAASEPPPVIVLSGHRVDTDGVFTLMDRFHDSRPCYKRDRGTDYIYWERPRQRWILKVGGPDGPLPPAAAHTDDEQPAIIMESDTPDPTVAIVSWQDLVEVSDRTSARAPMSVQSQTSVTPALTFAIPDYIQSTATDRTGSVVSSEGPDEEDEDLQSRRSFPVFNEEDEDSEDSDGSRKDEKSIKSVKSVMSEQEQGVDHNASTVSEHVSKDGTRMRWSMNRQIKCCELKPAPAQVYISGHIVKGGFTGVYKLRPSLPGSVRASYIAEETGTGTAATIRFITSKGLWIIERIPKLKGRRQTFKADPDSLTFALATARYDSPTPVFDDVVWQVRHGSFWLDDEVTSISVVREPPKYIFLMGALFGVTDKVEGTYQLDLARSWEEQQRPHYINVTPGHEGCEVYFSLTKRRWIVDMPDPKHNTLDAPAPRLEVVHIDSDAPNPSDIPRTMQWQHCENQLPRESSGATLGDKKEEPERFSPVPLFACYDGEMPPKQLFIRGGYRGVSGVYTFIYLKLHNGRVAYRKPGTSWYCWWSEEQAAWCLGQFPKGQGPTPQLVELKLESLCEAWCKRDTQHPAASDANRWIFKGKNYRNNGTIDTHSGLVTSAAVAGKLGEEPLRCEGVRKPMPWVVVKSLTDKRPSMTGVYFLASTPHGDRCYFEKQCNPRRSSWTIFFQTQQEKWFISKLGLEPQRAVACIQRDTPDPTCVSGNWMERTSGIWSTAKDLAVEDGGEPPECIFLHGALLDGDGEGDQLFLGFNGTYKIQDELHEQRPYYRKVADPRWAIRFHPSSERWIVDGRHATEVNTDGTGLCSVVNDCVHPAVADLPWSLWSKQGKRKTVIKRNQAKTATADAMQGASMAKMLSDHLQKTNSVGNEPSEDEESGISPSVVSGQPRAVSYAPARSVMGGTLSVHGGRTKSTFAPSVAPSKAPRSMAAPSMAAPSAKSPRSMAAPSLAPGDDATLESSERSISKSKNKGSSQRGPRFKGSADPWEVKESIAVVPVGEPPDRLLLSPLELTELSGLYVRVGVHDDRPAYRLVDESGSVKTELSDPTSEFDFSPFGYGLRWYGQGRKWILGECAHYVTVEYSAEHEFVQHVSLELSLIGGSGYPVRLQKLLVEGGPAGAMGVVPGCELVCIDGTDKSEWINYDILDLVAGLPQDVELIFKCMGFSDGPEAIATLEYDAPYPSFVFLPWLVSEDGELFFFPDKQVQCRAVEAPPRKVRIEGFRGKPKEMNGMVLEMLPNLVGGRLAYVNKTTELYTAIFWSPQKSRWIIYCAHQKGSDPVKHDILHGLEPDRKNNIARATCHAPNPTVVMEHGGIWETRDPQKRTLRIVREGLPIEMPELSGIFTRTLKEMMHQTEDEEHFFLESPEQEQSLDDDELEEGSETASSSSSERVPDDVPALVQCHFDGKKLKKVLEDIEIVLEEARLVGITGQMLTDAANTKKRLNGWILLNMIAAQGIKRNATAASWFETITSMKACIRLHKPDPNISFKADGRTPLHLVALYGVNESWTFDAAYALKRAGANLDQLDSTGMSPIMLAIVARRSQNVRALLRLLSASATYLPLKLQDNTEQEEAYLQAAEEGDANALKAFLGGLASLDLNLKGPQGRGAMHLLAMGGYAALLEILICGKADPNMKDNDGMTALHYAADLDAHVTIMVLLKNGASPTVRDDRGRTPVMVAMERKQENACRELFKNMVPWEDIQAIVGRKSVNESGDEWKDHVRRIVSQLLLIGFGDLHANPLQPKPPHGDRLQVANQVVALDPDIDFDAREQRCCLLEPRGALLCRELIIPLLLMGGECQLEVDGDRACKHFLKYLLGSGLSGMFAYECQAAAQESIARLSSTYEALYSSNICDGIRRLLPDRIGLFGPATISGEESEEQTANNPNNTRQIMHQMFAHGPLEWIPEDGSTKKMLVALAALVDADAYKSIAELMDDVIPSPEMVKCGVDTLNFDVVLKPFWNSAYSKWLVGVAQLGERVLPSLLRENWSSDCCRVGPTKKLETVLKKKLLLRGQTYELYPRFARKDSKSFASRDSQRRTSSVKEAIGSESIEKPTDPISESRQFLRKFKKAGAKDESSKTQKRNSANPFMGLAMPAHPLEAGGVLDLLRFTVTISDENELFRELERMRGMRLQNDGVELVFSVNGFQKGDEGDAESNERAYNDIRLGLFFEPYEGCRIFCEMCIVLTKYLDVKKHMILLTRYEDGLYARENNLLRAGCGGRSQLEERVSSKEYEEADGKMKTEMSKKASDATARGSGKPRKSAVQNRALFERCERFTDPVSKARHLETAVIWRWVAVDSMLEAMNREVQPIPPVANLRIPDDAVTLFTTLADWRQLKPGGTFHESPNENSCNSKKLAAARDPKEKFAPGHIAPIVKDHIESFFPDVEFEDIDQKKLLRLLNDLDMGNVHLFVDHDGRLVRVRDYVTVHVHSPVVKKQILLRETRPRGVPTLPRNACDQLLPVATKVVAEHLPQFLQGVIRFEEWKHEHGLWAARETKEDSSSDMSRAWCDIPCFTRTFTVKASISQDEVDPYILIKAAVGID